MLALPELLHRRAQTHESTAPNEVPYVPQHPGLLQYKRSGHESIAHKRTPGAGGKQAEVRVGID